MNIIEKWKLRAVHYLLGGFQELGTTQEYAENSRIIVQGIIRKW